MSDETESRPIQATGSQPQTCSLTGWLVTTPYGQVFVLEGASDAQQGNGSYQAWLQRDGDWVSGAEAN